MKMEWSEDSDDSDCEYDAGADPDRKFKGGDVSNIWQSILSWQSDVFPNCKKSW